MGDVQVALKIWTHYFMQRSSYLLRCTPPFSTFIKSFISFDSSFLQVFGCYLGPNFFNSLEGPLACKQIFFLITFGGVKFLLTTTIAPTTYFRSWAFVVSIIVVQFMVNQHPFLLEALTWMDNKHLLFLAIPQGDMQFSIAPNLCMFSSF